MKGFFTNLFLYRMEQVGNNDLMLIKDLGPGIFETRDLKRALVDMKKREKEVEEIRMRIYRIGACSAVFLFMSYVARAFGASYLSLVLLLLFPALIVVFSIGQIYLRRKYPAYIYYNPLRESIQQELDFRKEESSIF